MTGLLRIDATGCMGHGRCYAAAPDLLHDDEEGFVSERGGDVPVPRQLTDQALAAADACPEIAIEYLETEQDWRLAWQPVIDAVGADLDDGRVTWGADPVEAGAIRRWLEPLEFDCALHTDAQVAGAQGYSAVTLPYVAVVGSSLPPVWQPGELLFDNAERTAQPVHSWISGPNLPVGPRTTRLVATDMEFDFLRPVVAGERVGRRGRRLLACSPKETKLGRGAFLTWETDIVTTDGEVVARMRTGVFAYVPAGETP